MMRHDYAASNVSSLLGGMGRMRHFPAFGIIPAVESMSRPPLSSGDTPQRPDALLLDIQLPTMSGLALYLAIVHRWPHLDGRIAIMTGDAEADEVRRWLEQNRCTVLRKPFDLREITDWLDHGLRSPQRELGNG